jgi:hypothetical protein
MWAAGRKLLLSDVLENLQLRQQPTWILFEFSGVGHAPGGLEMSVFERNVLSSPSGYRFDPAEFREFIASLRDVSGVKLIGVLDDQRKIVEINGFDSTSWDIWVDDEMAHFVAPTTNGTEAINPVP